MQPFAVFIVIMIVIWTLNAIAAAVNKQKEAEKRRAIEQWERAQGERPQGERTQQGVPLAPPQVFQSPQQIAETILRRFPEAGRAPQPVIMRALDPVQPKLRVRSAKAKRGKVKIAPAAMQAPSQPPPLPMDRLPSATPPKVVRLSSADAPSIAKWLRPQILRQQFVLTEILQPPLALREPPRQF